MRSAFFWRQPAPARALKCRFGENAAVKWYARQNLLVVEDVIERLCSPGLDVFHRFRPEMVEPSRLGIGLNLAIPRAIQPL
ncbi:MAG: hypothetical protein DME87_13915 [Verrucomicrobia bacterium]|nr:MAG: hypothetical protein DME87_13915 [Verrucomicrobiota bacterium]